MSTIGLKTSINERPHRVTLQNPGPPIPDGDGGYQQTWFDLTPPVLSVRIEPATAEKLERLAAGTVISSASHIVHAPYHPQITTQTRLLHNGRRLSVTAVSDPEERHVESVLVCEEVVA